MFKKDDIKHYLGLPLYCFIALAIAGIISSGVAWGGFNYVEVFICFLISYPCTVALWWSLTLINNTKWEMKKAFIISAIVRLLAVAAAIGFSYLYLYFTNTNIYCLFEAPIVLLLGYIIAIVSRVKEQ